MRLLCARARDQPIERLALPKSALEPCPGARGRSHDPSPRSRGSAEVRSVLACSSEGVAPVRCSDQARRDPHSVALRVADRWISDPLRERAAARVIPDTPEERYVPLGDKLAGETISMKAILVTDQVAGAAGMTLVERPKPPAAPPGAALALASRRARARPQSAAGSAAESAAESASPARPTTRSHSRRRSAADSRVCGARSNGRGRRSRKRPGRRRRGRRGSARARRSCRLPPPGERRSGRMTRWNPGSDSASPGVSAQPGCIASNVTPAIPQSAAPTRGRGRPGRASPGRMPADPTMRRSPTRGRRGRAAGCTSRPRSSRSPGRGRLRGAASSPPIEDERSDDQQREASPRSRPGPTVAPGRSRRRCRRGRRAVSRSPDPLDRASDARQGPEVRHDRSGTGPSPWAARRARPGRPPAARGSGRRGEPARRDRRPRRPSRDQGRTSAR